MRGDALVCGLLAAAALSISNSARAEETPNVVDYQSLHVAAAPAASDAAAKEKKPQKALVIAGAIITGGVWVIRAGITFGMCASYAASHKNGCNAPDYVGASLPVFGAWVQASQGIGGAHGAPDAGVFAAIIGAGVSEAAGVALITIGLLVRKPARSSDDVALRVGPVSLTPAVGPGGVAIFGTF